MFLNKFFNVIKPIPSVDKKIEKVMNTLVSRYSNGNISIQKGNYLTKEDIKNKEKYIFTHRFI